MNECYRYEKTGHVVVECSRKDLSWRKSYKLMCVSTRRNGQTQGNEAKRRLLSEQQSLSDSSVVDHEKIR